MNYQFFVIIFKFFVIIFKAIIIFCSQVLLLLFSRQFFHKFFVIIFKTINQKTKKQKKNSKASRFENYAM